MAAYQITQTITDPGTAPQRTDPDNFDTRADAFLLALSAWGAAGTGDLNVLVTQLNALSTAVNGYSTAAAASETAAEAAQAAAESASGATEWLVGTTYDEGDVVWGSDYLSYRASQSSNTGHDPVGDGGTWWTQMSAKPGANADITSLTGLTSMGALPARTPVTDSAANFAANFTGADLYGGTFVCNSAGTCQLPEMAAGMNFTIITLGDIEVVVDTNAADGYLMDGVTNAEGKNITNLSTSGDIAVFQYYTADDWLITTNGWTAEA